MISRSRLSSAVSSCGQLVGVISKTDKWTKFLDTRRSSKLAATVKLSSDAEYIEPVAKRYSAPLGSEVYANSGMNLGQIDVWGFDYDYTIACWGKATSHLIYNLGLDVLLKKGYPKELEALKDQFDGNFVIRGLSYDRQTGFLLKLDQFGQIQLDSVYLGRRQLEPEEVKKAYSNHTRLSREYMHQNLEVCSDLFSIPEACLLADVTHFFESKGTHFHPSHLHQDVNNAVDGVHRSSLLHEMIREDLPKHLEQDPLMGVFFERLREGGKKVFLLSNSSYGFIDAGMRYLLEGFLKERKMDSWLNLFDVVIVNAKKPLWYNRPGKFRKVDTETGALSILPISEFVPGEVYAHGSLDEFHNLLGVQGDRVLYVGDQIYTDLLIPQKMAIWKTAAIIRELAHDVEISSSSEFQSLLGDLLQIEVMLEEAQFLQNGSGDKEALQVIQGMLDHRQELRIKLKNVFNPYFGSAFRTYDERTLFFFNLCRVGDLYTSSLTNFLNYPLDFSFQVKRTVYPHESPLPLSRH